ncbi:hypothetical protein FB451DRAFT_1567217 [Mycena latifolia]|nr:hypothetical protein FB451DRAFT_1567217 [Mycena latifolia]
MASLPQELIEAIVYEIEAQSLMACALTGPTFHGPSQRALPWSLVNPGRWARTHNAACALLVESPHVAEYIIRPTVQLSYHDLALILEPPFPDLHCVVALRSVDLAIRFLRDHERWLIDKVPVFVAFGSPYLELDNLLMDSSALAMPFVLSVAVASAVVVPRQSVRREDLESLQARAHGLLSAYGRAPEVVAIPKFAPTDGHGTNVCIQGALDWMLVTVMDWPNAGPGLDSNASQFAFFEPCIKEVVNWQVAQKVAGDPAVQPYLDDTLDWAVAKIVTFLNYDGPDAILGGGASGVAPTNLKTSINPSESSTGATSAPSASGTVVVG